MNQSAIARTEHMRTEKMMFVLRAISLALPAILLLIALLVTEIENFKLMENAHVLLENTTTGFKTIVRTVLTNAFLVWEIRTNVRPVEVTE